MKHGFKLNEAEYDVALSRSADGYRLHINDQSIPFKFAESEEGGYILSQGHSVEHLSAAVDGDDVYIHLDGETYQLRFEHALQRLAELNEASSADGIKATMPGSLISLDVKAGDHVKPGQTLLVMESMKMETTIIAPREGVVAEVHVGTGETFDKDALLVTLEPEAE